MQIKNKILKDTLKTYKEISLLAKTEALLSWDLNVNMPPRGISSRSQQIAYLSLLISDKWQNERFKGNIEELRHVKNLNKFETAIVRNLTRESNFYLKVPKKVIVEFSEATSKAFVVWRKARADNNFKLFAPHLDKLIKLNIQIADNLGYKKNPYDALLDLYEPDLTADECKKIFKDLSSGLTEILAKIQKSSKYKEPEKTDNHNSFSTANQIELSNFVLRKIGYDFRSGRMDTSAHPFTTNFGTKDVRITNRYDESQFIESIMVALHEGGHALYEQGVDPNYENTPLSGGVSLGIHESQSRFWENQIGRSLEFVKFLIPKLKKTYPQLSEMTLDEVYRGFNVVKPSLIRVEADEVTYNLHILLRFELEDKLINGKLNVKDLPEAWNEKMNNYLKIKPKNFSDGVLQDVHWSHGSLGYFPSYTLGNLYAAQITNQIQKKLNIKRLTTEGDFKPIFMWLRKNIYTHGSLYMPKELINNLTAEPLSPKYFTSYLKNKFYKIYS